MEILVRGPSVLSSTEATRLFFHSARRGLAVSHLAGDTKSRCQEVTRSSRGPSDKTSNEKPSVVRPGDSQDPLEEEHLLFAQSFEEPPLALDEFGSFSSRPAAHVDISSKPRRDRRSFGKPRFAVKGIDEHEPLYQPSLWQQLLKKEIDSRAQRQAISARRTAKVLGGRAASAAAHSKAVEGSSVVDGELKGTPLQRGSAKGLDSKSSERGDAWSFDALSHPEETPDWRLLSGAENRYELHAQIRSGESCVHSSQGEAVETWPSDGFLKSLGTKRGAEGGAGLLPNARVESVRMAEAGEMIDAGGPVALATHAAGISESIWKRLSPHHLHTQQRLMKARSSEELLAAVGDALGAVGGTSHEAKQQSLEAHEKMQCNADSVGLDVADAARRRLSAQFGLDCVNVVTAIHRLGKLMMPDHKEEVLEDRRFGALMHAGKVAVPLLDPQGASNLLWGVTRLEFVAEWMPKLLAHCASLTSAMSPHQVATCLYSLSRLPTSLEGGRELQAALTAAAAAVTPQIERPLDLTCICTALARFRVRDLRLFGGLAGRARELLPQLSMSELASVAWAFAAVGLVDRSLFVAIQRKVEEAAELCSPGDIVQLAWALARCGEEKRDLFDYTFTPIIRGCLPQLNARQLATVASSYAQAGVQDMDLLSDLSVTILPHLSSFTPQQISTVSVAFAHLGYFNREFMGCMAQAALKQLQAFSVRQLTRTLYGLGIGGCRDTRLLDSCCNLLQQRQHALQPDGLTQALVGLSEAEYLSHPAVPQLLRNVGKMTERLLAEDCVQLLLVLSKVDSASRPSQLVQQIQQQMETKLRFHWCLDCESLCDLMQALQQLRVSDPQLLHLTMRKLAYLLGQASSREFLRLLGSLAAFPAEERLLVRTHIHRRLKVQAAISAQLERLDALKHDPESVAALLFACSQLGFADQAVVKMSEGLQHKLESEGELLSVTSLCHFLFANTEMNLNLGWTRSVLQYFLARRYRDSDSSSAVDPSASCLTVEERQAFCETEGLSEYRGGEVLPDFKGETTQLSEADREASPETTALAESLLRAAFVCVSLGEEDYLLPLMEEVARLNNSRLPSDLLPAQQVCLHLSRFAGPAARGNPSKQLQDYMSLVLGAPRYDVYYRGKAGNKFGAGAARLRVKDYNFDAWLSESLIQMKIPHKVTFVVSGVYRVSVAFPLEKHLIDVLTFQDLLAPSSKPTATAELRQRQLTFLGWTVHSVHLRSLYSAVLDRNLRSFVAQIAAACCPQAAEFVSFRPPKEKQQQQQRSAEGDTDVSVSALLGVEDLENLPSLQRGSFEAFELNDDDLRGPSHSRRLQPPRQRNAVADPAAASKQSGAGQEDLGTGVSDVAAAEQQKLVEADAHESLAIAEALQAAYSPSRTP